MDTKQRSADCSGISNKVLSDLCKRVSKSSNEVLCRFSHDVLKPLFVLVEPFAIVVGLEVFQKREQCRSEELLSHTSNIPDPRDEYEIAIRDESNAGWDSADGRPNDRIGDMCRPPVVA